MEGFSASLIENIYSSRDSYIY